MTKLNKQNIKHINNTRFNKADPIYDLWVINKFINGMSKGGDKEHTQKHVYKAFLEIQKIYKTDPSFIFSFAVKTITPNIKLNTYKRGRKALIIPSEIMPVQRYKMGVKMIVNAIKQRNELNLTNRIKNELIDILNGKSIVFEWKKKHIYLVKRNRLSVGFVLKKKKKINI